MEDKVMKLKDGRNLGYAEYEASAGAPVLLFHGTPGARLNPFCTIWIQWQKQRKIHSFD